MKRRTMVTVLFCILLTTLTLGPWLASTKVLEEEEAATSFSTAHYLKAASSYKDFLMERSEPNKMDPENRTGHRKEREEHSREDPLDSQEESKEVQKKPKDLEEAKAPEEGSEETVSETPSASDVPEETSFPEQSSFEERSSSEEMSSHEEMSSPEETSSEGEIHLHTFVPVEETIFHEAVYEYRPILKEVEVVDEEAYEEVQYRIYVVFSNGTVMEKDSEEPLEAFEDRVTLYAVKEGLTYSDKEETIFLYHPAVTHTELVEEEEKVLVQEAYEEVRISYWICTTCGETQEDPPKS